MGIKYLYMACRMGNYDACYETGILYETGTKKTKKDVSMAMALYQKACVNNIDDACIDMGMLYKKHQEYSKALYYFMKSCHDGNAEGCYESAKVLEDTQKHSKSSDIVCLYHRACSMGFSEACKN
ncbi:hypothetical protein MNB_SV-4-840 [hydrothermal vent metagenome]|uniref:Beta-lactamase n=1 Tax=hydrothermal vent metagenome TaxID=652676 RepID=A0A1W1E967_9ZZZZ